MPSLRTRHTLAHNQRRINIYCNSRARYGICTHKSGYVSLMSLCVFCLLRLSVITQQNGYRMKYVWRPSCCSRQQRTQKNASNNNRQYYKDNWLAAHGVPIANRLAISIEHARRIHTTYMILRDINLKCSASAQLDDGHIVG